MLLKKQEWKSMTPLDKATYIAQILAPFSLLITVIFAWLGWQEARKSREEQLNYFIAQNSPDVVLSDVNIIPHSQEKGKKLFQITLDNVGGSNSKNVCITVKRPGGTEKKDEYLNTCDQGHLFHNLSLKKGARSNLSILRAESFEDDLGFIPESASIYNDEDAAQFKLSNVAALISIYYEGFFDDGYWQGYSISFSPEKITKKEGSHLTRHSTMTFFIK